MGSNNYTKYNTDSIYTFLDEEDTYDAIVFLGNSDNFRSFDQGLIEILVKKGYVSSTATLNQMAEFLYKKICEIGSLISLSTINSWFLGKHRPKIESGYRKQIYEICFALNLSHKETVWFFHHVYYDRAFNCHTIDESVFYYCFKNDLSYKKALMLIEKIEEASTTNNELQITSNYTQFVSQMLDNMDSDDKLVSFLIHNKENFTSWNHSSYEKLIELVHQLLPSEKGKKEIENIKRRIKRQKFSYDIIPKLKDQQEWGLVMQEFFFDFKDEYDFEQIEGKNISSKKFLLDRILDIDLTKLNKINRFNDKFRVPYIVKNNFPTRKLMSDVLSEEKALHTKSYDSIRKLIIFLYFYRFWCEVKVNKNSHIYIETPLSDIFIEEINDLLFQCGYENIYAGNPYDWIFLCSAQAENPLSYFRQFVSYLLDE